MLNLQASGPPKYHFHPPGSFSARQGGVWSLVLGQLPHGQVYLVIKHLNILQTIR